MPTRGASDGAFLLHPERRECAPEGGEQRGVDGVSVVHVQVVPAAFCGKVVEAKSEDGVRPGERKHVVTKQQYDECQRLAGLQGPRYVTSRINEILKPSRRIINR